MRSFEKWWKRQGSHIHKLSISMSNPGGKSHEEMAELAYKEALEWVLKEVTLSPIDLKTIQKELGEE